MMAQVRQQIRETQEKMRVAAQVRELRFDIGLDEDLLAAFNSGLRQELILQIQIVRLLRQLVTGKGSLDASSDSQTKTTPQTQPTPEPSAPLETRDS